MAKEKFVIAPHMRLQEWVAEEKGYFADEGLDYVFGEELVSEDGKKHDLGDKVGAYQTFEKGRSCDISSACHWTVNAAAASGHGKLYRDAYSVGTLRHFRAARIRHSEPGRPGRCADLRRVPVGQSLLDRSRRWNNGCPPMTSTCRSAMACCSSALKTWSIARCRRHPCSARPIMCVNCWASGRSVIRVS